MEKPVVVIGSGLAGYLFAKEFRQLNKDRPLKVITMTDGRFYSKPLLSTALTQKKTIDALAISDAKTTSEKMSLDVITHTKVMMVDAKSKMINYQSGDGEKQQEYGDLVLACGADTVHLSLEGNGIDDLHSVNNIEDYEAFCEWIQNKKHIGILGAGLVGCEFANDLINNGYEVTVMAPETHPLARLVPEPVGRMIVGALAEKGVQWVLGYFAKQINFAEGGGYRVTLDNGAEVVVDGVMSAVGLQPKLDLAMSAGIKTNRGIVVDSQLRSSDPHIFAIGDCAEVNGECRQYVAPLLQCARALAKVLAGQDISLQYPIMPIVIKTSACPVVVVPPKEGAKGEWFYEGENGHLKALFKDSNDQLHGFVLIGDKVREKVDLVKQLE